MAEESQLVAVFMPVSSSGDRCSTTTLSCIFVRCSVSGEVKLKPGQGFRVGFTLLLRNVSRQGKRGVLNLKRRKYSLPTFVWHSVFDLFRKVPAEYRTSRSLSAAESWGGIDSTRCSSRRERHVNARIKVRLSIYGSTNSWTGARQKRTLSTKSMPAMSNATTRSRPNQKLNWESQRAS